VPRILDADDVPGNYRRLRDLRQDAPEELEVIIRKALSPNPDDRFASMHAFARELVKFADVESKIAHFGERDHPDRTIVIRSERSDAVWSR
jgi:hypothetical protein